MSAQDRLRARYAAIHGAERTRRAEWLALLQLSRHVLDLARRRREVAEAAWESARAEADERPPSMLTVAGVSPCEPQQVLPGFEEHAAPAWAGRWPSYVWRALETLAAAAADEATWIENIAEVMRVLARDAAVDVPRRLVTHGWSETPTVTLVYDRVGERFSSGR